MLNVHLWPHEFFIISCIMLSLRNFFPMNQTFVLDGRHIAWYLLYIGCAVQTLKVDKIKWMVKKFLIYSYHQIWNWKRLKLSKSHDSQAQHESFDLHWQYCIWWRILIFWMTYFWIIFIFDDNHIKMNINKLTVFGFALFYIVPNHITISLQVV